MAAWLVAATLQVFPKWQRVRTGVHLEGPPGSPKLFLTPAKGGGAPPDACRVGGAAAPSAASPSVLASGQRMGAGKGNTLVFIRCRHPLALDMIPSNWFAWMAGV
jgi:hypothetical protein